LVESLSRRILKKTIRPDSSLFFFRIGGEDS